MRRHPASGFRAVSLADEAEIYPAELDLEPAISAITERAQQLTGATGAAIALRAGDEIVCRARAGRTAPDLVFACRPMPASQPRRFDRAKSCSATMRNAILESIWQVVAARRAVHPSLAAATLPPNSWSLRSAVFDPGSLRRPRCRNHAIAVRHDGRRDFPDLESSQGTGAAQGRLDAKGNSSRSKKG